MLGSSHHQTTTFFDATTQYAASVPTGQDSTRVPHPEPDSSLSDFFTRPIQIASYAWTPGTALGRQTIDPWTAFFTNPRVMNRLANFNLLNCTLRVKVQVSGNPFYYGLAMLDWLPYASSDLLEPTGNTFYDAIPATQRLKVLIDPTTSSGGEIDIPFLYHFNSLNISSFSDVATLGRLTLRELASLQHATGSILPITINIFAWAEDVQLTLPTSVNPTGLVAQSEEVQESITEKVCSATAEAADALSVVPTIAPLATATSMAARGLGKLARLYGFSKPTIPAEPKNMRLQMVGPLATTDTADPSIKLTVTSDQQVSIDPRIAGVATGDELTVADIAGRETALGTIAWSSTQGNGTLLYNWRVQPFACPLSGSTYYPTACAFACMPFKYWRGTLRYRFRIVNSGFHRGQLRFTWDPNYIGAAVPEMNVGLNRIVNIESERDVVIDIPWGSHRPFLARPNTIASSANYGASTRYTTTGNYSNGVLAVHVQNTLASAGATATSISVVCFVSCPDLCVAVPNDPSLSELVNVYSSVPQASMGDVDEGAMPEMGSGDPMAATACPSDLSHVFFGEKIVSFRQLLKRFSLHSMYRRTAALVGYVDITATDFPMYKGYTANPMHATSTGKKINYVNMTLLNYLAPAYLGCRGGMRTKYVLSGAGVDAGNAPVMTIKRGINYTTLGYSETAIDTTSASSVARSLVLYADAGLDGTNVTVSSRMPVLEAELPYYKPVRFDLTRDIDMSSDNTGSAGFGLGELAHKLTVMVNSTATTQVQYISRYVAASDDFTLIYFIGAPPMVAMPNATLPAAAIV